MILVCREAIEVSRKWGTYYIIGILFKIYFKINKFSLSKNVLRAIEVSEMPPLECFPKSHVVTYKYYLGVSAFLNEEYTVVFNPIYPLGLEMVIV